MHYNVPQFIDIEDTIVGPLTAKQLMWLFLMAAVIFLLWFVTGTGAAFFIIGIPISLLFVALAFYKPHGQPFLKFIIHALLFVVRPKIYMWKRENLEMRSAKVNKKITKTTRVNKKTIKQAEIIELAKLLDSESDIIKEDSEKI